MSSSGTSRGFYVYVLLCSPKQSLYCGYTLDWRRRYEEHVTGKRGAKYTRGRTLCLAAVWKYETLSDALRAEVAFKRRRREIKQELIQSGADFLGGKRIDLAENKGCFTP
jgi:putative endonuclease